MRSYLLLNLIFALLLVTPPASVQASDAPALRLYDYPLLPTPEQQSAIELAAKKAAEEFYQTPSAANAASTYPIWLRAQTRKSIDAQFAVLEQITHLDADAKKCQKNAPLIGQAAKTTPFSLAIVLTALQCAELAGQSEAAAHLENVLSARVSQIMDEQRGVLFAWPIRVLHHWDVLAWAEMQNVEWRLGQTSACALLDCLIRALILFDRTAGTQKRLYFDISSDYLGGDVGDKAAALPKLVEVLEYYFELEEKSGFASPAFSFIHWQIDPVEEKKELAKVLRDRLSEPEFQRSAAIALVQIAVVDKEFVLRPEDLTPLETAAAEKDYDAMVALAMAHAMSLIANPDRELMRALLKAANRLDPRSSAGFQIVAFALAGKRDTKHLEPLLEEDARQSRFLALYFMRLLNKEGFGALEVKADGSPLSDAFTTMLDAARYQRWRFNDFAKQRACRFGSLGLQPAKQLCIQLLKHQPMLLEARDVQAMQLAKLIHKTASLSETDVHKMPEHCESAAVDNLRYGDPDRALMWSYSCHQYDLSQSLKNTLLLYLRGANVSEKTHVEIQAQLADLKNSSPVWPHLSQYFLAASRAEGRSALAKACDANELAACQLLALQMLPWNFSHEPKKPNRAVPAIDAATADLSIKPEQAKTLLKTLKAATFAARGRGIELRVDRGSATQNNAFGTDFVQLEPPLIKEIRGEQIMLSDGKRSCIQQARHWSCKANEQANFLLPVPSHEITIVRSTLMDVACGAQSCKRLSISYIEHDQSVPAFAFVQQFEAIQSISIVFEASNQRPLQVVVLDQEFSVFYQYTYDQAFTPNQMPARCGKAQQRKPTPDKGSTANVILVDAEAAQNCKF